MSTLTHYHVSRGEPVKVSADVRHLDTGTQYFTVRVNDHETTYFANDDGQTAADLARRLIKSLEVALRDLEEDL